MVYIQFIIHVFFFREAKNNCQFMSISRWNMISPLAFFPNGGFLLIVREAYFCICIPVSHVWAREKYCWVIVPPLVLPLLSWPLVIPQGNLEWKQKEFILSVVCERWIITFPFLSFPENLMPYTTSLVYTRAEIESRYIKLFTACHVDFKWAKEIVGIRD